MGNKRVSQLTALTAADVQPDDLFLIIDTSEAESKKIDVTNLGGFLSVSGSLIATHASTADVAYFVLGSGVSGPVALANYASTAGSAVSSSYSDDALSASYAKTASWAINTISGGGGTTLVTGSTYPITSSWAINSISANTAGTASVLIYVPGVSKNTASYAITAENVNHSVTSDTASYINGGFGPIVSTASWSDNSALAVNSLTANTASFLAYAGFNNGTASYALNAGGLVGTANNNYGVFNALTQSLSASIISTLDVRASSGIPLATVIESVGTCILNFTSSVPTNDYSLSLSMTDRYTGRRYFLDSAIVSLNTTPIVDQWDTLCTGSIYFPFTLLAQTSSYGRFYLEVSSSSPNLIIDPSRLTKFKFSSLSDQLSVYSGEIIDFSVTPLGTTITFSSSLGGPFVDTLPGLLITGSQNITVIDISNQLVTDVAYTWKCSTLNAFFCSNNILLSSLTYDFPSSLQTMSCYGCSLTNIVDLSNTDVHTLNCQDNYLTVLPNLPYSISYLNCSNNNLIGLSPFTSSLLNYLNCSSNNIFSLPTLPVTLQYIYADETSLTTISSLPDSVITASFISSSVSSITALPMSLSYLYVPYTQLPSLPALPISLSYLDISHALFSTASLEAVGAGLVTNSQISGTFIMTGYGPPPSLNMVVYIANLTGALGWTVITD